MIGKRKLYEKKNFIKDFTVLYWVRMTKRATVFVQEKILVKEILTVLFLITLDKEFIF